ncbi:retrovirus-related pol polyprotein from transposon TNT 1-94 [Tanacetum coccineum]
MPESPFVDYGFVVPVSSPRDDLIACLNKAMAFLTAVASLSATSSGKTRDTSSRGNTTSGIARVVKCYNCQGEGHMARQCTQPKRPRNAAWYKEKAMLVEAQEARQILDEEQLAFLADPGVPASQAQTIIPHNVTFQTKDLDTYDSDCDDLSNAQAVLMANISTYVDVPSELPKVTLVKASLKKLKFHLAQFDSVVKKRTTPSALEEGEWGFKHTKNVFNNEIIPFLISLKDIFNVFDKDLLNEITEVQTIFDQMEVSVQQSSVNKQCVEITKKELLLENDRLLHKIMSQDVMITFFKSKQAYNALLKSHSQLEKHCISLEVSNQLNQEVFQKDESCINQNALEILEYFEKNDLKAQLQDKDTTICKLKDIIKSIREISKDDNVNNDLCELETKNVELENSVAKLFFENERLCKEINHLKQVFKDQFDSIKKTRVRTKEQSDFLIDQLNLKSAKNEDLEAQIQDKLDLEPLPPRLLQNREVHIDYLRNTQEQANILREIVEQAKAKQPLDGELDLACKYTTRIQELLVYVQDTCPNAITPNTRKVAVTPMNNVKKVRFTEPLISLSNSKQVESSNTSDSNTPMLSSTGVKCFTRNCRSKPPGNKKNDRISQTPSRNKKNKVEAQPRKVNNSNRVVKPVCDVDVKHSLSNTNSEILCATCNKSMFDGVHDKCLLDLVQNGNKRTKSAKKHKNKIFGNLRVVQIVLWYLDSGCSKHMTGNRSQLMNFVSKFLGTVRFGNDQIARIMGYGDYQLGNVIISRVYYVEGLGHNLFSVGQFCDADLEVAFRKNTCFIRNLEGVDLLSGSRDTNLYTISLDDMLKSSSICLLSKASKTKSWLWHRRLSHLNFACALGKSKKSSHQPKAEDTNQEKLYLLHMDLCGPMRVASINRKRYILVIVDDYSRFTWVRFLKTKDEAPAAIIKCIKNLKVHLNATVWNVRTDNGTEFVNQTLREWYENVGITHQTSVARTP